MSDHTLEFAEDLQLNCLAVPDSSLPMTQDCVGQYGGGPPTLQQPASYLQQPPAGPPYQQQQPPFQQQGLPYPQQQHFWQFQQQQPPFGGPGVSPQGGPPGHALPYASQPNQPLPQGPGPHPGVCQMLLQLHCCWCMCNLLRQPPAWAQSMKPLADACHVVCRLTLAVA